MIVVITMAGLGERFRQAGYQEVPKFMVQARGRPLFAWALDSLRNFVSNETEFIFVVRSQDKAEDFIVEQCRHLGVDPFSIVSLDRVTDGQASTALAAGTVINNEDRPIAVYNIDTYVESEFLHPTSIRGEGWIPCFPGVGCSWSFVRIDDAGRAVEVREKQPISPHATIGFYWFSSFALYRDLYDRYFADPAHAEHGERYIAPLYNELISRGRKVFIHQIPAHAVHPLGTPSEVRSFVMEGNSNQTIS